MQVDLKKLIIQHQLDLLIVKAQLDNKKFMIIYIK